LARSGRVPATYDTKSQNESDADAEHLRNIRHLSNRGSF